MLKRIKSIINLYILAIHGILVYLLFVPSTTPSVQKEEPVFSVIEKNCSHGTEIPKESKQNSQK